MPRGRNICHGLWLDDELYAVIVYGNGVNPYQQKFLGVESYVELKRLCRTEPKKDYQLSRFIRKTLPPVQAVVAFADPEHGHHGGIYKATGFKHEGNTQSEMHVVDRDGKQLHRRVAYRASKRWGCTIGEARERLELTPVKTLPKHRWVLRLYTD